MRIRSGVLAVLLLFGSGCVTRTVEVERDLPQAAVGDDAGAGGTGVGGDAGAGGASLLCGTGGAPSTGGSCGTAGAGGSVGGAGGVASTGGMVASTGGDQGTGGLVGTGGAGGMGGDQGTGGTASTGGAPGTGGDQGTGGTVVISTGGAPGTGGDQGTGGAVGTGGAPSCGLQNPLEPLHKGTGYVETMTPTAAETYFAPALIRVWGHAPDVTTQGGLSYAPQVDFYRDGVLQGSAIGPNGDFFQLDMTNVPAGCPDLFLRAHLAVHVNNQEVIVQSAIDTPVTVLPDPTLTRPAADIITLSSDVTGSAPINIVGTPTARKLIVSTNGSAFNTTGPVNIQYADVLRVGSMTKPWLTVNTTDPAGVTLDHLNIDASGQTSVGSVTTPVTGPLSFTNNTVRSNALVKVNGSAGTDSGGSQPSVFLSAAGATKLFAGNTINVSFVRFNGNGWMVGGDTSAAGNVVIGVRGGLEFDNSAGPATNIVRGNFLYHRYPYGFSQGLNLDSEGVSGLFLVEHNTIRGGSWMVRNIKGTIEYNLFVDNVDEAVFIGLPNGTIAQYNIFIDVGYTRQFSPSGGVVGSGNLVLRNNTIDEGGPARIWPQSSWANITRGNEALTVTNSVFTGFAFDNSTPIFGPSTLLSGANSADWNAFWNPDGPFTKYSQASGNGTHDLATLTSSPFAGTRSVPFPIADADIGQRRVTQAQVLALYRSIYAPRAGSPLAGAGTPQNTGVSIGAIGVGIADLNDKFAGFGP